MVIAFVILLLIQLLFRYSNYIYYLLSFGIVFVYLFYAVFETFIILEDFGIRYNLEDHFIGALHFYIDMVYLPYNILKKRQNDKGAYFFSGKSSALIMTVS